MARTDAPRALQVLTSDLIGGSELHVLMLADRLNHDGLATDVATLAPRGPIARELEARAVAVWSLRDGRGGLPIAALRLARLLRSRRYALIEAYGFKASMIARLAVRALRQRTVVVHGVQAYHVAEVVELTDAKGRFAFFVERLLGRWVDAYDVNASGAMDYLAANGLDRSRMTYIPNGIDTQRWTQRAAPPARELTPTVLCSARFVPRKRQEDLVRAIAELRRRDVDCRAVLAGDGPTLPSVRQLADELGVGDRTEFLGAIDGARVRELMESATVFCLPSLWEGMPACVLEAMATGVPVVGAASPGIEEYLAPQRCGLLFPAKDEIALADALDQVIRDPELAATLSERARALIDRDYTLDLMVARKRRFYDDLLLAAAR